jgi:fumarylacetoacetate (FAA) hydrolase
MRFGDSVRMQAKFDDGRDGPFGVIEQKVIANK